MAFILRPHGNSGLTGATYHAETSLPQVIAGLAAGGYDVGRLEWAADPVTVTDAPELGARVLFEASDQVDFTSPNTPAGTLAMRFKLKDASPGGHFLCDWLDWFVDGSGNRLFVNVGNTSFGLVLSQVSDGSGTSISRVYPLNSELSVMLAVDKAAGLSGSKSVSLWVNGEEVVWGTVTSGPDLLKLGTINNDQWNSGRCSTEMELVWFHAGHALDPATQWSDFFDGSNHPKTLASGGVVGTFAPTFWQFGNAAAWMSGTDRAGHSYTVTGTLTDVA